MRKRTLGAVALLTLLAACNQQQTNTNTLTSLTFGDWSSFDPAYCYDSACGEVLQNTLEPLFFYDGESTSTLSPLLAAELPTAQNGGISADGRTYRVNLKPDLKFSDGSPLTSEDVEYSLERLLVYSTDVGPAGLMLEPLLGSADLLRGGGRATFDRIDRAIETDGENTVVFNLAKPFAPFPGVLAGYWAGVVSKADAVKKGDWDGTAATWEQFNNLAEGTSVLNKGEALGSGPFTLERYDADKSVVLARNSNYHRSPAALERVVLLSVDDENTRIQTFRTGDAQMFARGAVSSAQLGTVRQIENTEVEQRDALALYGFFMTHTLNAEGTGYLGSGKLDGQGIPANFFSDRNVRLGFAHAFDYPTFVKDVLDGNGSQQNSILVKGIPGAEASNELQYRHDPARAAEFFRQAFGGQVWENGFSLPAFYNAGNVTRQRGLELLKANLLEINPKFRLEVRELQFSQILSQSAAGKLPLWMGGWGADFADAHTFAQPFLDSRGNYGRNIRFRDASIDRLVDQAIASTDPAERQNLYGQIARRGFEEAPVIPVYQPKDTYVHSNRVKGRVFNTILSGDYFYPITLE